MNIGVRGGYQPPERIKEYLSKPDVLASLGAEDETVIEFKVFKISAGGTQSQLGKLKLSNGKEFFIKQTPQHDPVSAQLLADDAIKQALGENALRSPFILAVRGVKLPGKNGLIIFPSVEGYMLFDSAKKGKTLNQNNPESYARIGAALSQVHIDGMANKNELDAFYSSGCDLTGKNIVVHDDFQSSNIMITEEGAIKFVDTEGVAVKGAPYQNIYELCKEIANTPQQRKAALEGYLSNFHVEKQKEVLDVLIVKIREKYKFEFEIEEIPKPPVSIVFDMNMKKPERAQGQPEPVQKASHAVSAPQEGGISLQERKRLFEGATEPKESGAKRVATVAQGRAEESMKQKADAERKAKEEVERKAKEEAERKAKEEAELKAKEEAERKAKEEAERKAKEEAERKAKEEAERKAKEEAERKAKEEAERKAKEEAKRKAKEEAERKAKEEAERKAKEEAERKAKEEAERKVKEEAERKAKEEAELKAKEEAERKAKEEAERKAKEEAERKAKEEAELKAKEEVERKAKEEAERKAKEEAERKAKEEAERKTKEEAERKVKEEAELKAKEEAERKAKEEMADKAMAEAEAKRKEVEEKHRAEEKKRQAEELLARELVLRERARQEEERKRADSATPAVIPAVERFKKLPQVRETAMKYLFMRYGTGKKNIIDGLRRVYTEKTTESGVKGLWQKYNVKFGKVNTATREKQIEFIADVLDKLQNEENLHAYEKGVILSGALQVVMDDIEKFEGRNVFKSRLNEVCSDLRKNVVQLGVQVDPHSAKSLFQAYQQNGAKGFKEMAEVRAKPPSKKP